MTHSATAALPEGLRYRSGDGEYTTDIRQNDIAQSSTSVRFVVTGVEGTVEVLMSNFPLS